MLLLLFLFARADQTRFPVPDERPIRMNQEMLCRIVEHRPVQFSTYRPRRGYVPYFQYKVFAVLDENPTDEPWELVNVGIRGLFESAGAALAAAADKLPLRSLVPCTRDTTAGIYIRE